MARLFTIPTLDGGLLTNVSPVLVDPEHGYAARLHNIDVSDLGILRKRPGSRTVLSPTTGTITGAHEYVQMSADGRHKVVSHGTVVQHWSGSSWTTLRSGLSSGAEFNFLTYTDRLVMANGVNPSALWDAAAETIITPTDFPVCSYLAEYKLRLAAAGITDEPSMLWLSHPGDPTIWDPDATGSAAVKVYVSPDDGEPITGLLNAGDSGLLVTKANMLYGLFGYTRQDFVVELLSGNVGSMSHKAMEYIHPYAYFVGIDGIYKVQPGQSPEKISTFIQDVFDQNVDWINLHQARSLVWKGYYIVTLPTATGNINMAFHTEREKWVTWSEPTVGEAMYVSDDPAGRIYYSHPGGNSLRRFEPRFLRDDDSPIAAEYHSLDTDFGVFAVEKELSRVWATVLGADNPYALEILYTKDGKTTQFQTVNVTASYGDRQTVWAPLRGKSEFTRFILRNAEVDQDFRPLSLIVKYDYKEVP